MRAEQWAEFKSYFSPSQFDSPDEPGNGVNMQYEHIKLLYSARIEAGVPFIISSGIRTSAQNRKIGGKALSSHLTGWASDIHINGKRDRYIKVVALLKVGFNRLEIMDTWIHADNNPEKDKNVIMVYGDI